MGDMLTLIEKAEAAFDAKKAAELEQKLKSNKFTLSDFYDQLSQLKNMGSLDEIAAMMPGMNAKALEGDFTNIENLMNDRYRRLNPYQF